jgi:predicted ATPase with chaperone activity
VCAHLSGVSPLPPHPTPARAAADSDASTVTRVDLADVRGQWLAKRALVIAAAGAHSLLLLYPIGPTTVVEHDLALASRIRGFFNKVTANLLLYLE